MKTQIDILNYHRTLLFLVMAVSLSGCILTARMRQKRQELQQLAADTPKFADFRQVDYSDVIKSDGAIVTYFYQSSGSFEDVKSFYTTVLVSRGWSAPKEERTPQWFVDSGSKRLIFQKGEYTIYVNYDPPGESHWRYALDFDWEAR